MVLRWLKQRVLTGITLAAVVSTYSMVSLAEPLRSIGDVTIIGELADADSVTTINGEPAISGRTVFDSSLITTPAGMTAIVNLGAAGRIEIEPGSSFSVSSDGKAIAGSLLNGTVTVLKSGEPVVVKTATGANVLLNAGESANSASSGAARDHRDSTGKCIDDNNNGKEECGHINPIIFVVVIGGVLAAVLAASGGGGGSSSGGTISPIT
ncbi:MAG: hypothetical protein JO053_15685 [Acidobacteria bacterium]|nr:hypothetical protein [Acidobacteriota bacterium]